MIHNHLTGERVKAKGPSLNAILQELEWSRDAVVSTQISPQGSDAVFIVPYVDSPDTTWLDL